MRLAGVMLKRVQTCIYRALNAFFANVSNPSIFTILVMVALSFKQQFKLYRFKIIKKLNLRLSSMKICILSHFLASNRGKFLMNWQSSSTFYLIGIALIRLYPNRLIQCSIKL